MFADKSTFIIDTDPPGSIRQFFRNYDILYTAYRDIDFDFPTFIHRLDDISRVEFGLVFDTLNIYLVE